MKAHDVRNLRICPHCHDLGILTDMIPTDNAWYHGRCYIDNFGEKKFLALPASHTGSIRLDDIGSDMMRKLLDARAIKKKRA